MLEYELNGNVYTEADLIEMAGGKNKLSAYIKSKGFKLASKKTKQPTKFNETFGESVYKKTFGFENPIKDQFSEINKTKKKKIPTVAPELIITPGVNDFGAQINGDIKPWSFKEEGLGVVGKAKKAAEIKAKEKEKIKTAEEQSYLDKTKDYRTRQALDELSFDNPNNINYDISKESVVETVNNLNKKINRLGLEAEEFGEEIIFRKIGANEGFGGTKNGMHFDLNDVNGMNKFVSDFGDQTYAKKVKESSKTKYPNLWEKITPPVLSAKEKKEQATKGLIEGFKSLDNARVNYSGSMTMGGTTGDPVNKDSFENPYDYELYKQWKKNPDGVIALPESRIEAWDKTRKEKFIDRASTDYARTLAPEDRKNLQILTQEKVNDVRYATKSLIQDIDAYKVKEKDWGKEVELYKKTPTPEKLKELKAISLSLIDEQNEIGSKQKQLQRESDYASTVLSPAITAFGANYNRINQLQSATESTLTDVAVAFDDIAAYGSSTILGVTHEKLVKDDSLGLIHTASELAKQKERYQKSIGITDINTLGDAGNWLMSSTVNTLPSIGMAFTGAAALPLFFASGYGGKTTEMALEAEEAKKRLSENNYEINNTTDEFVKAQLQQQIAADEKLLSLPEYKKFAAKSLFGAAEVGFEMIGTLKILKGIGKAARMLPKKTLKEGLLFAGKNAVKSFNTEGLSELGTTLTDNFVDIHILGENKNFFEGGLESYAQGGLMGVGFGGVETYNVMKRAITSELAAKKQSRRMQDIANQISELTGIKGYKLDQSIPLPMQTPAVQKLVNELVDESESIESNIIGRLGVDLTLEQATQVGDVNRQIREVNKDFSEAAKDSNLSPAQLKTLETYYRGKFNELVNQRETLLTDPVAAVENKQKNIEARFEFDLTQGYGMYNYRMQKLSVGQVTNTFNNLNNTTKTDLLLKAKTELEQETIGSTKTISENDIKDRALNTYVKTHYTKAIKDGIKNANAFAESKGMDVKIIAIENIPDSINDNGETVKGQTVEEQMLNILENSEVDKDSEGYKEAVQAIKDGELEGANTTIDGKPVVLINMPLSVENNRTGIGSHEVLHTAVKKAFADQKNINKAGESLLQYLETFDPNLYALVTARIDSSYVKREKANVKTKGGLKQANLRLRDENGDIIKNEFYYEEAFNALSDIGSDGIKMPKDSLNSIRNFINNLLPKDFPKFKENQGADVYQFVKDYNREAHFGKKKSANTINFSSGIIGDDQEKTRLSKSSKELKVELEDLKENEGDYDPYEFDQEVLKLEGKIKREIEKEKSGVATVAKKEVTEEDADKEIIKNERGSISSDKVQRIYETKGVNGAQEIIDLFKPITKKLVDKRMDAPGFERKLLTDEIETGEGGLLYLIKSYKPEKGVPLAAYINKQLPLRAIAASRRVLDKDFSKDVTEEKGLIAEETVSEAKEKPKYNNALEAKVFSPEILKTATNKIVTIVRTLKSRIDAPITLNRTVTPLISEIRDEVGKQLDIDIKTMLGGKKDGVLKKELLRNKKYILENMTTTWLMGKDGQGGIPQAIQKQINGKFVSFPDWVGQKIDREKTTTDQAGRTSGAELVRRLPNVNNNVSNEDFLAQIIGPDGNPIRGRKESVSKAMAEEGAFDIINADLAGQGPIYEALSANQTRLGAEVMENFPAVFQKDSDRGNIKLSKTFNNFDSAQKQYIINNSINLASELSNINYNLIPDEDDIFKALQKVYNNGTISNENLKELSKDIKSYYTPILAPLLKKQSADYVKNFINASLEENSNKLDYQKNNQLKDADGKIVDSIGILFNQQQYVRQAQSFTSKFITNLGKKYNNEELSARLRKIGSFLASQAQIGDDSLTIVDNRLETQTPRVAIDRKTKKEKKKRASDQIYSSKVSFWTAAKFTLKDIGVVLEPGFSRNRKGYIEDDSKKLYANRNNAEYLENKKKTAIENQEFLYEILDWYYDPINKVPDTAKAMLWKSLNSNQESPLRKAAIAKWIFNENSGPKDFGDLRYEHLKSVDKTRAQLYKLFSGNLSKQERKNQFADIMEDFNVAVIPISMDKEIGASGFQTKGIAGDVSEGARYYNIVTMGNPALYSLINLDPNAEVKTLGDGFVRFSKTYDPQNGINIDAVANSLTTKYSKSPKGISVFDFDDTTGITKGSVLYTMPDGSKGKLNAEEFAKEGANFLEDGAAFDFSEFSKVVDGKPGPMVEKMKKMIGKFGPENFFILTARPAEAAAPIHEFLSSIGINIPLENITGLGNSTAQAKADWMVGKAAEGYNDFYFADDAPQNVEAVKKALDTPGISSKVQQAKIKFSLTSRQDLKWKQGDEDLSAKFQVKGNDYRISMIETAYMEYNDDVQKILFDLVEENNLDEETTIAAYDGEAYNLEFWDKKQGNGITGTGNAAEVFGVVINGVTERIKKKNIEALVFTAKEFSRIKLYDAMTVVVADKLGWNVYSKEGVYILAKKPKTIGSTTGVGSLKPVQNVLKVVDVKSPIQQNKIKFSKTMSDDFNRIIEENKGVESYKVYSDITARRRGIKKNRFDFYVPPSAADFELLLYKFMGKGELGEEQKQFFQDALIKPYINGVNLMDSVRQSIKKEYKALLKSFPDVRKDLEKLTPNKDFTYDQAMRVAIWSQYGTEIPGLSQRDVTYLTDLINNDPELAAFKDGLIVMGRQKDGWLPPGTFWDSDTIISDLYNITEGAGRKKFLGEFIENTENIFGKWEDGRLVGPNINKVEAVYGTNVREALEDSIYRMINGKNRSIGQDKETSAWSSWVNGSTGAIMFLNTRSAALQMLGAVNFLNWRDNNPFNAGKAFLNQPQYWKDFSRIWNSDKLKERRGGLREDVASAEIANAAAGSKNKVVAVTSYLLKIGYTPTQLADSFAIASGGAPFYRNRINSYMKEGLTEQEAEAKAWQDFSKVSDETQQSGDPKDISKQQSSAAGRLLLVFQNFTMQQSRIVKKAALDLKNGRGDAKTNISKIFYYLAVQNIMFSTLQQGLFAVAFDDDDDDKDKDKKKKTKEDAAIDVANGVLDSILRGTGFVGGITATLKNTIIKYFEEQAKKQKAEYAKVVLEVANMSPPIGSKLRKTYSALQQTKYDKDLIAERGWGVMQDGRVHLGPMYSVTGKLVEVGTNFPMDRLVNKVENVSQAFNSENTVMQRIATAAGYSPYTVGIEGTKGDLLIKETAKEKRAEEGTIKSIITKRENAIKLEDSINKLSIKEYNKYIDKRNQDKIDAKEKRRKILEKLNAN